MSEYEKAIKEKYKGGDVVVFKTVDSTNNIAKQLALNGANEGTVIISECQTDGKGRLGRSFFSPEGGIYMSVILRPDKSLDASLMITVAAAVAACRSFEKNTDKKCFIKWVNDIYISNKKVCGILTVGSFGADTKSLDYAVMGIGINLSLPKQGFPEEIKDKAGSLFGTNFVSEEKKISVICDFLNEFINIYSSTDKKDLINEYRKKSFLNGKTIEYNKDGITHIATVKGIDNNAGLILNENGNEYTINAGEVQIKKF